MEHEPDDERPLLRSTRLPPAAAALRSSGDDRRTRARELREALDDLRAEVEGEARPEPREQPAPAPEPSWPAEVPRPTGRLRRLALVAAAAIAVLGGATGVVQVVAWSMAGGTGTAAPTASASTPTPSTGPSTGPTPGNSPGNSPGSSPGTTPPAASATAGPAPPPAPAVAAPPDLPTSGPGADAPGAQMVAVVGTGAGGGAVDVYERLVVRPGTTSVRLAAAPGAGLPAALRDLRTAVSGLQVTVDGRPAAARADGAAWDVTPSSPTAFTRVEMRYRVTGALVRPTPAPPGRRTLLLRPLTGPAAATTGDPVLVRLTDPRVANLYCPAAPRPLCAVTSGPLHVATVPAGAAPIVLAQVTLR